MVAGTSPGPKGAFSSAAQGKSHVGKGATCSPQGLSGADIPCCIIGPDLAQKWGNSDFAKSELGMNNPVLLCGCASSAC